MALMDMEQAVLRKAQEEADAILNEARAKAAARVERESARLREEHERRVAAARAELEAALERETSAKETANRLGLLKIKNEILEAVFSRAVEGIRTLPDDSYARWLKGQVAVVPRVSGARVAVNERDAQLMAGLLRDLPGESAMQLAENPARIQAGFLVQGEQADLDFSVEALLGVLWESLAQEIATKLFDGEAE